MIICHHASKIKIAGLNKFKTVILSSSFVSEKTYTYFCHLLNSGKLLCTGNVQYKKIENSEDLIQITRIFLNNCIQEESTLKDFCRQKKINNYSDFQKITKEYFDNTRRINSLPNSSYIALIDFIAEVNGGNLESILRMWN